MENRSTIKNGTVKPWKQLHLRQQSRVYKRNSGFSNRKDSAAILTIPFVIYEPQDFIDGFRKSGSLPY